MASPKLGLLLYIDTTMTLKTLGFANRLGKLAAAHDANFKAFEKPFVSSYITVAERVSRGQSLPGVPRSQKYYFEPDSLLSRSGNIDAIKVSRVIICREAIRHHLPRSSLFADHSFWRKASQLFEELAIYKLEPFHDIKPDVIRFFNVLKQQRQYGLSVRQWRWHDAIIAMNAYPHPRRNGPVSYIDFMNHVGLSYNAELAGQSSNGAATRFDVDKIVVDSDGMRKSPCALLDEVPTWRARNGVQNALCNKPTHYLPVIAAKNITLGCAAVLNGWNYVHVGGGKLTVEQRENTPGPYLDSLMELLNWEPQEAPTISELRAMWQTAKSAGKRKLATQYFPELAVLE